MSWKLFWEADLKADQTAKSIHPWHILTKTEITLAWIQTEKSLTGHWGSMEQLIAATLNLENCQLRLYQGFPGGSDGKEIAFNAGDPDSMPGSGKIPPGEGNGNQLQYSCLENSMHREARQARSSPRFAKSGQDWLSLSAEWRTLRINQEHQLRESGPAGRWVGKKKEKKKCFSEIPEAQGKTGG